MTGRREPGRGDDRRMRRVLPRCGSRWCFAARASRGLRTAVALQGDRQAAGVAVFGTVAGAVSGLTALRNVAYTAMPAVPT